MCRSGCGCPVGTVLDEEANACVNLIHCPKGESHDCHMTVTLPPCVPPTPGQVSNSPSPSLSHIFAECPVEGQEYYDGVNTCVPCTGTCTNRNPVCTLECRSGCGCPVGTVLDEQANACVNETDCPRGKTPLT